MSHHLDRITLEDMDLPCRIGVAPGEAEFTQPLRVRLTVGLDLDEAAQSGRLDHTLDYGALAAEVGRVCGERTWTLLESLALALVSAACQDPRVREAEVGVTKRRPPLGDSVGPITVRLKRRREELI